MVPLVVGTAVVGRIDGLLVCVPVAGAAVGVWLVLGTLVSLLV
jgi:hypothetical protein